MKRGVFISVRQFHNEPSHPVYVQGYCTSALEALSNNCVTCHFELYLKFQGNYFDRELLSSVFNSSFILHGIISGLHHFLVVAKRYIMQYRLLKRPDIKTDNKKLLVWW